MQSANGSLRKFIKQQKLTIKETAHLSGLSQDTIKAYLAKPNSKRFRTMPESTVELLTLAFQRQKTCITSIHNQFQTLLKELDTLAMEGVAMKKILAIQMKINDLWTDYIALDLDKGFYEVTLPENEELQKISELQNKPNLTEGEKKILLALIEKHEINIVALDNTFHG